MRMLVPLKYGLVLTLVVGLLFSSSVFSVLVYGKMSGKSWASFPTGTVSAAEVPAEPSAAPPAEAAPVQSAPPQQTEPLQPKKDSVLLEAPIILQNPELPRGCEITSLTMLLQFYGYNIGKMELAAEMLRDPTPLVRDKAGRIASWGNPNTGFVGEVTAAGAGFGIYHKALFPTLEKYVPTAVDLTGSEFDILEHKLSQGIPVVVWTTINYQVPYNWVQWNSPDGPVRVTFSEHSVLLTGYDRDSVYVNDPLKSSANIKVDKAQFVKSWAALGKQALSYNSFK
ncbi:C39 family peptidase [Paenibacillus turpanensis]|uniref:C39 family peptidase n=1 Tax=Paenibacillus turpanensis TaxID=2689078 RepID=UPI001FB632E6|nr:C39 family peptidase [Paenibacillus turpanensis]